MPRGGSREGAGRKAGVPSIKTIERRAIADKAVAEGKSPLEVMLENMRHFHNLAQSAESALAELSQDNLPNPDPKKQFEFLLAEVKKAAGLRDLSQGCARDAAPYLHPRLASTAHTGPDGKGPVLIDVTDEQRERAFAIFTARIAAKKTNS